MNVTNILIQLLVSLKTAYSNHNVFAYSKYNSFCVEILFLLFKDGLIAGYSIDSKNNKIKIKLKYIKNKPLLTELNLISKPSLKVFSNYSSLQAFNNKYNYFFLSTSHGLLSSRDFSKNPKAGGLLLFGCKLNYI